MQDQNKIAVIAAQSLGTRLCSWASICGHDEEEELINHLTKIENLGIPEPTESDKKIFDEALLVGYNLLCSIFALHCHCIVGEVDFLKLSLKK